MITSISIHLREDTKIETSVRSAYTVVHLGEHGEQGLFFRNEEHLRAFAESILQQLNNKEEQTA
ncbi:hypothetical protein [Paenibacillus silvisoli]|uniref:hypothetical protein n=1 Tax=Paenibacillus silvisoli TaxID=3110539 RepID=UPI002803A6D3|nr:hypothetical protein [Paenibacillus silvisoli]